MRGFRLRWGECTRSHRLKDGGHGLSGVSGGIERGSLKPETRRSRTAGSNLSITRRKAVGLPSLARAKHFSVTCLASEFEQLLGQQRRPVPATPGSAARISGLAFFPRVWELVLRWP